MVAVTFNDGRQIDFRQFRARSDSFRLDRSRGFNNLSGRFCDRRLDANLLG